MFRKLLPALVAAVLTTGGAGAQDDGQEQGRGVARLSLISGDVSVRRGDTNEWVAAAINAPLLSQDRVLTGMGSRTEVQFDASNFARLADGGELRLADIENRRYLVRLAAGTMTWRVLRDRTAEVEIATPSIAVRPVGRGSYRVTVRGDGSTEVTVRSGEAEIFTPQGSERLRSGRTLVARGEAAAPEFRTDGAMPLDEFDRWSQSRDRDLERSESYRYVSRDVYGVEDLDGHGRWVNTPEYGQVWVPAASGGWAPYRNGRWSWLDYYGWSWVSYDPWGWAPYHYGRWFHRVGLGWCWWPGRQSARHYWSPALVGFFGWGNGRGFSAGVGIGFGNWGWVPLAPFERYSPWYGRGNYGGYRNAGYVNNSVSITNINITNVYRNARFDDGVTVINGQDFGRGGVNPIRFDRNQLNNASFVRGQLPAAPGRESLRWSDRAVSTPVGPSRGDDRFFSRTPPGTIDRVPFESQRAALQDVSRRTFGVENGASVADRGSDWRGNERRGDVATGGGNIMERGGARAERSVGRSDLADGGAISRGENNRGGDAGGWWRFGDVGGGAGASRADLNQGGQGAGAGATSRGEMNRGGDTGGWRRFGDAGTRGESADRGGGFTRGEMNRGGDTGGWRRFGDAGTRRESADRGGGFTRGEMNRGGDRSGDVNTRGDSMDRGGAVTRGSDSNGWRRFGDSGGTRGSFGDSGATTRGSQDRGGDGGWNRMEGWRGGAEPSRTMPGPTIRERGGFGGSFERNDGGMRSTIPDRGGRGGDLGSGRMSGPVVRERSSGGGGFDSFGGMTRGGGDAGGVRGGDAGGVRGGDAGGVRGGDAGGVRGGDAGGGATRGGGGGVGRADGGGRNR
jgi:hypothetical protein